MFNTLYRILGKNRKSVQFLFWLVYFSLLIMFIGGVWGYNNAPQFVQYYREIGKKFGTISVGLLMVALTPGVLKRLGILKQIEAITVLFRRQFGVLAFFTAMMHLGFLSWIKKLAQGTNPLTTIFTYKEYGFGTLIIFFLLWILSNNFSMKLLGKWWVYLQRLAYLAVILLIIHIIDAGESKTAPILVVFLVFETISWIVKWWREKNQTNISRS